MISKVGALLRISSILVIPLVLFILFFNDKPPSKELENARIAISEARDANAATYSRNLYSEAVDKYDKAMQLWTGENKKIRFRRDYNKVMILAEESFLAALGAREDAIIGSAKLKKELAAKLDKTKVMVSSYQELFSSLPVNHNLAEANSQGRLFFAEAELAFREGHYALCEQKLKQSNHRLNESYNGAMEMLKGYFESWPDWSAMVTKTINDTRKGGAGAIVVDKLAKRCYLYKNGKMVNEFKVDLGRNWIGDKRELGDRATPEGVYRVTEMKSGSATKYYRAMLIDYPNSDDRARFNQEKKKGLLKRNADIGGLIEIHGMGGTGIDWTDGCIALADRDMELLFSRCTTGTVVTIVGSVKPLEEMMKNAR